MFAALTFPRLFLRTFPRGRIAALFITSQLALACGDDGDGDEAADSSSGAPTGSDSSSDSTDPATDPATSSSSPESSGDPDGGSSSGTEGGSSDSGSDGSSDSGSETAAESLAIIGDWIDGFGGTHAISETEWVQTYGRDSFLYTIDHFDNAAEVVIAQSQDDDGWARYDWTYVDAQLYYCQTAFGLDSAAEADATPRADDSDPATAGCGGFSWSSLSTE
jgi:hypothetical protein